MPFFDLRSRTPGLLSNRANVCQQISATVTKAIRFRRRRSAYEICATDQKLRVFVCIALTRAWHRIIWTPTSTIQANNRCLRLAPLRFQMILPTLPQFRHGFRKWRVNSMAPRRTTRTRNRLLPLPLSHLDDTGKRLWFATRNQDAPTDSTAVFRILECRHQVCIRQQILSPIVDAKYWLSRPPQVRWVYLD